MKGQANPGKTKVTQQRIEPDAESADPLDAEGRRPRDRAIGSVASPDVSPWMRDIIRSYFLRLRAQPVPFAGTSDEETPEP